MEDTSGSAAPQEAVDPEVHRMWRQYQMCQMLHCTPTQLDDQPAILMDWFWQFQRIESAIQESEMKKNA